MLCVLCSVMKLIHRFVPSGLGLAKFRTFASGSLPYCFNVRIKFMVLFRYSEHVLGRLLRCYTMKGTLSILCLNFVIPRQHDLYLHLFNTMFLYWNCQTDCQITVFRISQNLKCMVISVPSLNHSLSRLFRLMCTHPILLSNQFVPTVTGF